MGIDLRRREILMAQHFLYQTQVGTVLDKMGREGMSECMRGYLLPHIGKQCLRPDHLEHGLAAQRPAEPVQKEEVLRLRVIRKRTSVQIGVYRIHSNLSDRDKSFLVSFAYDPYEAFLQV